MQPADVFLRKALQWANQFEVCCYLDSHQYPDPYSNFDAVVAADAQYSITCNAGNAFEHLKSFYENHKTWMFGWLGYELKNEIEDLTSKNQDDLGFDDLFFFVPKYLIGFKNGKATLLLGEERVLTEIEREVVSDGMPLPSIKIQKRLTKEGYVERVNLLKQHILRGDIYEANYCQEFYCENTPIDPLAVFKTLSSISPTPFSGYFKRNGHYILSATPERFLRKAQQKLISQPIKGTAKRGQNPVEDEILKTALRHNAKERAENIMIVDLVRNDLTRCAKKGSVTVDELCQIYTFPQVHQMISTVSCELGDNTHFIDAIKMCFPMGSMTGAPKRSALKLIEQYEVTKRGVYSGSFGYIGPDGDFDFNVVIRSILYNQKSNYLSFQVGSAITFDSDPHAEYEECLLKATAIKQIFGA